MNVWIYLDNHVMTSSIHILVAIISSVISTVEAQTLKGLPEYVVSECYGDIFSFDCGPGNKIRINRDFFGFSPEGDSCSYGRGDCIISNPKSNSLVHRFCTGRRQCTYYQVERRACGGYYSNYQQVEYQCVPDASVTDICSTTKYEATSTFIGSPNFPNNYPPNQACACTVTSQTSNARVRLEVVYMAIKYNYPCRDWLKVGRRQMCGTSMDLFSGSKIPVEFRSDKDEGHSGFWLHFHSSAQNGQLIITCGNVTNTTSSTPTTVTTSTTSTTPIMLFDDENRRFQKIPRDGPLRKPDSRMGQDGLKEDLIPESTRSLKDNFVGPDTSEIDVFDEDTQRIESRGTHMRLPSDSSLDSERETTPSGRLGEQDQSFVDQLETVTKPTTPLIGSGGRESTTRIQMRFPFRNTPTTAIIIEKTTSTNDRHNTPKHEHKRIDNFEHEHINIRAHDTAKEIENSDSLNTGDETFHGTNEDTKHDDVKDRSQEQRPNRLITNDPLPDVSNQEQFANTNSVPVKPNRTPERESTHTTDGVAIDHGVSQVPPAEDVNHDLRSPTEPIPDIAIAPKRGPSSDQHLGIFYTDTNDLIKRSNKTSASNAEELDSYSPSHVPNSEQSTTLRTDKVSPTRSPNINNVDSDIKTTPSTGHVFLNGATTQQPMNNRFNERSNEQDMDSNVLKAVEDLTTPSSGFWISNNVQLNEPKYKDSPTDAMSSKSESVEGVVPANVTPETHSTEEEIYISDKETHIVHGNSGAPDQLHNVFSQYITEAASYEDFNIDLESKDMQNVTGISKNESESGFKSGFSTTLNSPNILNDKEQVHTITTTLPYGKSTKNSSILVRISPVTMRDELAFEDKTTTTEVDLHGNRLIASKVNRTLNNTIQNVHHTHSVGKANNQTHNVDSTVSNIPQAGTPCQKNMTETISDILFKDMADNGTSEDTVESDRNADSPCTTDYSNEFRNNNSTTSDTEDDEVLGDENLVTLGLVILAICVGIGLVLVFIILLAVYCKRKRQQNEQTQTPVTQGGNVSRSPNRVTDVDSSREVPTSSIGIADGNGYRKGAGHQTRLTWESPYIRNAKLDKFCQVDLDFPYHNQLLPVPKYPRSESDNSSVYCTPPSDLRYQNKSTQAGKKNIDLYAKPKRGQTIKQKSLEPTPTTSGINGIANIYCAGYPNEIYSNLNFPDHFNENRIFYTDPSHPAIEHNTTHLEQRSMATMPEMSEVVIDPENSVTAATKVPEFMSDESDWETRSAISI